MLALLNEACRKSEDGLIHSYSRGESTKIIRDLGKALMDKCQTESDDPFPVYVTKCPSRLSNAIGHGKPLEITEEHTSEWFKERAYPVSKDPYTGLILFGVNVNKQHPVLAAGFEPASDRLKTQTSNFNSKIEKAKSAALLSEITSSRLRIDTPAG
jgi:hypothetical protein